MNLGLTPEQVAQRREGLGGSDAGEVMTGDWRKLWRVKTGREEPEDLSDILAVQMGHATEEFNAHWYEKVTGHNVENRGVRLAHPKYPFMVANLDGVTWSPRGNRAYWDAKHVGRLDEQTVLRYSPQMAHCCAILGLDHWVLSVFIGNGKHEIVEQECDPLYTASLIEKEREFWNYVVQDIEPPEQVAKVLAPKPQPKLRSLHVPTDHTSQTFEGMVREFNWLPDACRLIREFSETHGAATKHAIVRDELKGLVPEDVGLLERGRFKLARDKAGAVRMSLTKMEGNDAVG